MNNDPTQKIKYSTNWKHVSVIFEPMKNRKSALIYLSRHSSCITNHSFPFLGTRTGAIYLAAILCILTSCGKTKDFEFKRIESLDLHDISFTKSSIGGRLLFHNPNHFGVTLKSLESDVEVDGNKLGTCNADSTIHIRGNEDFSVPVVIHFTSMAAIMGGLNFLSKDSVMIRFTGSMKVGRVGVFINYKFDNLNKVSTKF